MLERGLTWYEWQELYPGKLCTALLIAFGEIATHNHFVLDRAGTVFKNSALVIRLNEAASEDQHLNLVGLLNSSTACFWLKQTCHCKGSTVDMRGARQTTVPFDDFYDYNSTKLKQFPIPKDKPLALPKELDRLAQELGETSPKAVVARWHAADAAASALRRTLAEGQAQFVAVRERMIALQEELDWQCYHLYGLTEKRLWLEDMAAVPPIKLGERAFEILMGRCMGRGILETTWFERHGSRPITAPPPNWSSEYTELYHQRHIEMQENKNIRLIEKPEYKRRWQVESWEKQVEKALYEWLANRLEKVLSGRDLMREAATEGTGETSLPGGGTGAALPSSPDPELLSCAQLADRLQADAEFQEVATLYTGRPDFDLTNLVTKLVEAEGVPNLPRDRYKETGLRKRTDWEHVWNLQRQEDALNVRKEELTQKRKDAPAGDWKPLDAQLHSIEQELAALDIPVPPKYRSADFAKTSYWRLRGKLDVPKERFILYPGCEREADPTPVLTWAGWNHLQQAQGLAAWYTQLQDAGASDARLLLVLAGLLDLVPWLKQWHNDIDPTYQERMGDFFQDFAEGEIRRHGATVGDKGDGTP
jgi:hypothetical protein